MAGPQHAVDQERRQRTAEPVDDHRGAERPDQGGHLEDRRRGARLAAGHALLVGEQGGQPGGQPVVREGLPGEGDGQHPGGRPAEHRHRRGVGRLLRRWVGCLPAAAVVRARAGARRASGTHTLAASTGNTALTRQRELPAEAPGQRSGDRQHDHRADVQRGGVGAGHRGRPATEVPADDHRVDHIADGDGQPHDHRAGQRRRDPAERPDQDADQHAEQRPSAPSARRRSGRSAPTRPGRPARSTAPAGWSAGRRPCRTSPDRCSGRR